MTVGRQKRGGQWEPNGDALSTGACAHRVLSLAQPTSRHNQSLLLINNSLMVFNY